MLEELNEARETIKMMMEQEAKRKKVEEEKKIDELAKEIGKLRLQITQRPVRKVITCFTCGQKGHYSSD